MSLLFSAVIIVALIYPGLVFRVMYFKGFISRDISIKKQKKPGHGEYLGNKHKQKFLKASLWEQVIGSLLPAFFIHYLCILILFQLDYAIDFQYLYKLIGGSGHENGLTKTEFDLLGQQFSNFTKYLAYSITIGGLLGWAARGLIYALKLDHLISLFKFNSEWYYLLSGRASQSHLYRKAFHHNDPVDMISINALVETKEQTAVYVGILYEFELTENGDTLERLVLIKSSKLTITKQQETTSLEPEGKKSKVCDEYLSIPDTSFVGHQFLSIPYANIKNMTVTYLSVDLKEAVAPAVTDGTEAV